MYIYYNMSHYAVTLCSRYLLHHRVHRVAPATFWRTLENLAQPGEGGRRTPIPFHYIYHHVQGCGVRYSWEGRYTPPPYFYTTPICTMWIPSFRLYPHMYSVLQIFPIFTPSMYCTVCPTTLHATVCLLFLCVPVPSTILCAYSMSMPLAPMSTQLYALQSTPLYALIL